MNKNPLISVVVPCYNVEKYVEECLQSIVNQSYENIEIFVINDGSTDDTESKILPFLEDSRVRYFKQENAGLSEARNRGLREIKIGGGRSEYLCFIDSDDYIHRDYIKILYENIVKYDADISICDFIYDINGELKYHGEENNEKIVVNEKEECFELIDTDLRYVVAWNKLYKTRIFEDLYYKKGKIHEDEFIAHHIFWRVKRVVRINEILYFYRKTEGSIMMSYTPSKHKNAIEAFEDRITFYKKNNIPFIDNPIARKWYIIYFSGLRKLNFQTSKNYILKNPLKFLFEFKEGSKKFKIKLYFKLLFEKLKGM